MDTKKQYLKIAHMYYVLGLTQDEIAKRLFMTRQKVNQVINSLVDLDMITITVNNFEERSLALENELAEVFRINQAIVVDCFEDESDLLCWRNVIGAAARYLEDTIRADSIIGVTWGNTVSGVIKNMSFHQKNRCKVVQLMGVQNLDEPLLKSDEIARSLSEKLSCPCYMLYAPLFVDHPETKKYLLKETRILKVFELIKQCDIAVVGIGELKETSSLFKRNLIDEDLIRQLIEEGFCADLNVNLLKENGSWEGNWLSDRIITTSIEDLKKIPNTVAVASGSNKISAIAAALNSGCINTLIIDNHTAQAVLDYCQKKHK
jgi:DNA-binding transcriptional regulator LsrR (DeoR family)